MERFNFMKVIENIFGNRIKKGHCFPNDFEVYLSIAYMDRDKREKENILEIWNNIFSLDKGNWVKNIGGGKPELQTKKKERNTQRVV